MRPAPNILVYVGMLIRAGPHHFTFAIQCKRHVDAKQQLVMALNSNGVPEKVIVLNKKKRIYFLGATYRLLGAPPEAFYS